MSYTLKTLSKGEKVISTLRMSKWSQVAPYVIGIALAPVTLGISLVLPLWSTISYLTTEFSITNKRVLRKKGWIVRKTDELFINKIDGLDVDQGIQGRILGFGNLIFTGTGTQKVIFNMIPNPLKAKTDLANIS